MFKQLCNFLNIKKATVDGNLNANPPVEAVRTTQTDSLTFKMTRAELYFPVVTVYKR